MVISNPVFNVLAGVTSARWRKYRRSMFAVLVALARRMICQPTATGADNVVTSVAVLAPRLVVKKRSQVPAGPKVPLAMLAAP